MTEIQSTGNPKIDAIIDQAAARIIEAAKPIPSGGLKTIYLCGAINGCTDAQCNDWRQKAMKDLAEKFVFLDPMRRDYRGREADCVNDIVHGDYDDIDKSDIILVAADKPSWGTAMEIHQSYQHGKFVVAVCNAEHISPWLQYHAHIIKPTLNEAIEYLLTSTIAVSEGQRLTST